MFKRSLVKLAFLTTLTCNLFCQANGSLETRLDSTQGIDRISVLHELTLKNWLNYPDRAMMYGNEALYISQALGDSLLISKSLRFIAGVYYYKADYETSLDFNFKAIDIAFALGDSSLINNGYNNIGLLYYDLGNYETALEYLMRSIAIKKRIGETYGFDTSLNNIGLIYERISDFPQARQNFFAAYDMAVKNSNLDAQVYSFNNIGITYRKEGQFELARTYFERAIKLADSIDNIIWGAVAIRNIGEIMRFEGRFDSANYYLQKSLAACESIGERKGIAESYLFLAKLSVDQGNISAATKFLDKSHELSKLLKIRYQLIENLRLYATIHLIEKNNQQVILDQFQYLDMQDSLFKDAVARNLALVPIKIKEEDDRIRLSQQQADLKSKGFINRLYAAVLIAAIPIFVFLVIVLRRNKIAYKKLTLKNEELKRTQSLLVTSEKMASLGVLAAGVGHEINNPLNYIKNGVNTLSLKMEKNHSKAKKELHQYFDIINEGVDRASKIVKSLSHFSRVGVGRDEYCRIEDILENCLLILGNKLRKIEVEKSYTKKPAIVHGNEGKLHQVFMNILSNAAQAITSKGKIEISTEVDNGKMVVCVKDNGTGIAEEHLTKIGDPFFTTKPPGEGTGLGLFITYAIIEEHHGEIRVVSKSNQGTEFIVTLPLYTKN